MQTSENYLICLESMMIPLVPLYVQGTELGVFCSKSFADGCNNHRTSS